MSIRQLRVLSAGVASLLSLLLIGLGHAAAENQQALTMIADFAERICATPSDQSRAKSIEGSVEIKVDLNQVLKKLADLGVSGAAKYKDEETKGVLQKDLARLMENANDCRRDVALSLQDKLIKAPHIPPGVGACATGAKPSNSFHDEPAANGSWDWNCDGKVERLFSACEDLAPKDCTPHTNATGKGPGFCSTKRAPSGCQSNEMSCGTRGYIYPCFYTPSDGRCHAGGYDTGATQSCK